MANFCIPKNTADNIKKAINAGTLTMQKLYKATDEQKVNMFNTFFNSKDDAKQVVDAFSKEMKARQDNVINKWAKNENISDDNIKALKSDLKNNTLSLDKLNKMTPDERVEAFKKYTNTEQEAQDMEKSFKTNVPKKSNASFKSWINKYAEKLPTTKTNTTHSDLAASLSDIVDPDKADKVAETIAVSRNGRQLTSEEIGKITELHQNLSDIMDKESRGEATHSEVYEAMNARDQYISSLRKQNFLESWNHYTNQIFISNPSIVKAWVGNLGMMAQHMVESTTQNLADNGHFKIAGVNASAAIKDYKNAMEDFRKYGYNDSFNADANIADIQFNKKGQGGNWLTRSIDTAARYTHGTPHAASSLLAYFHTLDIKSTEQAEREGLTGGDMVKRANELYNDAKSFNPKDPEAAKIKLSGMADAAYYTNMDKSGVSEATGRVKSAIEVGGKYFFEKAGINPDTSNLLAKNMADFLIKVVTVPSNIVAKTIDYTFIHPLVEAYGLSKYITGKGVEIFDKETGKPISDAALKDLKSTIGKTVVSAGIYTSSYALAAAIGTNNYQGVPRNPAETAAMNARGMKPNTALIGGHRIPLGILGPIGVVTSAILSARQNKGDLGTKLSSSASAYVEAIYQEIPVSSTLGSMINDLSGNVYSQKGDTATNLAGDIGASAYHFAVPNVINTPLEAMDPYQRVTTGSPFDYMKSQIPGVREQLPIKYDETGRPMPYGGSNALNTATQGTTGEPVNNTPVAQELSRLAKSNSAPSLANIDSDPSFKALKQQLSPTQFTQATTDYTNQLNQALDQLIQTPEYQQAYANVTNSNSDEMGKKQMIEQVHTQVKDNILSQYGYQTPTKTPTPTADSSGSVLY